MLKSKILDWKTSTWSWGNYNVIIDWPWYYDGQLIKFIANHANWFNNSSTPIYPNPATLSIWTKPKVPLVKINEKRNSFQYKKSAVLESWATYLVCYNQKENVFEIISDNNNLLFQWLQQAAWSYKLITNSCVRVMINWYPYDLALVNWEPD